MKNLSAKSVTAIKWGIFCLCLLPLLRLLLGSLLGKLGADPVADISHTTGIWTLRLLLLMLALSPIKQLTGWHWLIRLRRTIALYAFFYACLHLASYIVFDQWFDWPEMAKDIRKRPYLAAGFVSFLLMISLAVTSTNAMMKRLGGRNWQRLHRLSYLIAVIAVFHYFWLVKRDINPPALYALILALLLCARMWKKSRKPIVSTVFNGAAKA
jgi:sulfoxide reductase heme-binding subunit YedZ